MDTTTIAQIDYQLFASVSQVCKDNELSWRGIFYSNAVKDVPVQQQDRREETKIPNWDEILKAEHDIGSRDDHLYVFTLIMASGSFAWFHDECSAVTRCDETATPVSKIILLGSGSSTGCPKPLCTMLYAAGEDGTKESSTVTQMKYDDIVKCETSKQAIVGDPATNKNYRNNPSLLISLVTENSTRENIVIDVGKTFREGALRWFPVTGIQSIDSIILTHEHMDAAGGLDDVRGFQQYLRSPDEQKNRRIQVPMPLFLSPRCRKHLQSQFPWLLPSKSQTGHDAVERHVASFDVTCFTPFEAFEALPGFWVTPLPLVHGEDLISFGFAFSINGYNVLYLSDISRMPEETLAFIHEKLPKETHLLVLDSLLVSGYNAVHYNLQDAIALVEKLKPIRTLLVGMNCDSFLPHDEQNAKLRQDYPDIDIQLGHDGLTIPIP